jgi:FtsZ-binding cell division protein ZapB
LRTAKRLVDTLERVVRIYSKAGFIVQTALMDMEFEMLRDKLPNITQKTTAAREHVGEIERKIQVVKERARSTMSVLPYKLLPKLVIIELMHFCVMWMNSFPVKLGISEKWSPREIVSRHKLDAKMHCKVPFGAYCEVYVNPDITNTMEPRTKWGICLGPTGNMQGSYKFLSLSTGKKVTRRKFTEMP